MIWTIASIDGIGCGGCGDRIPAECPVALVTVKRLVRCRVCAEVFGVVDEQAIDAARHEHDAQRARDLEPPAPTLRTARPTYRHAPAKAATGFTKLADFAAAFDPKAAAANDHE